MKRTHSLSQAQQEAWRRQLPKTRLSNTKIADRLVEEVGGTAKSHQSELSRFFRGKEAGLRAFFDNVYRLEVLARCLEVTPTTLRHWLDLACATRVEDPPDTIRVPGFEDFGPVPVEQAFFPPRLRQARYHFPAHQRRPSSSGGRLDIGAVVEHALLEADPPQPKAVVLMGGRGTGRSPMLVALAQRLAASGRRIGRWHAGRLTDPDAEVLVVDDLDGLVPSDRTVILERLKANAGTLLCSVRPDFLVDELPAERALIELAEGDEHWACGFLDHLTDAVADGLQRPIDTGPLRRWISEEPDKTAFLHRADTLSLVARHVFDGGRVPVPSSDLVGLFVDRWVKLLRRKDRGAEALTVELCLPEALARLARDACREARWTLPVQHVARALVEVAGAKLAGDAEGTWGALGAPGMLSIVDALERYGFFARSGDGLRPAEPVVLAAALGRTLRERPTDFDLLARAVADSRWHEGVLAAAHLSDDIAPILAAIELLPLGVRVHAYPLATRLLAAPVPCLDAARLQRWFHRCVVWWASTPPEARSMVLNVSLTSPSSPQAAVAREALVGSTSPLLVLARASKARRHQLPNLGAAEDLRVGDILPADERRYLALMGRAATAATLADAVLIGAPFQSDDIIDPIRWERFPSATMMGHELPGGLTREEYAIWWRTIAAPRLAEGDAGQAWIAGTADGWCITWSMHQTEPTGVRLWADALAQELAAQVPGAPTTFAEAVAFLLFAGGTANLGGLQSVWGQLKAPTRRAILRALPAALPSPEDWRAPESMVTWVLRNLLRGPDREEAWSTWTKQVAPTAVRIPWRAFLDAGLDPDVVLAWASKTLPEAYRKLQPAFSPLASTGGGLVFAVQGARDAPQAAALDHLLDTDVPARLEKLLRAPTEWRRRAWGKLQAAAPERARIITLERAASTPDTTERLQLTRGLMPRPGEVELWRALVDAAETWHEYAVRLLQAASADSGEGRWEPAELVVTILEALTAPSEQAVETIAVIFRREEEDVTEAETEADAVSEAALLVEQLQPALATLLIEVGTVLSQAPAPEPGVDDLVRRIFTRSLRPQVLRHPGLWSLAWRAGGLDWVTGLLVEGQLDQPAGEATRARLDACVQADLMEPVVRALLTHPTLGETAALVVAHRGGPRQMALLREALESRLLHAPSWLPDSAARVLLAKLASADPAAAVEWLADVTTTLRPDVAEPCWAALIPFLPPGSARIEAVRHWSHRVNWRGSP